MTPFTAFDPDGPDVYRAMAEAARPIVISVTRIQRWSVQVVRLLIQLGFLGLGALFLWLSWVAPVRSFREDIFLDLCSGAWFFWAAPFVLRWGHAHRVLVPIIGAGIAALALLVASALPDYWQSFTIGSAITLLMLVTLEISMSPWIDRLATIQRALRQEEATQRAAEE
jgi:hypothetical protein